MDRSARERGIKNISYLACGTKWMVMSFMELENFKREGIAGKYTNSDLDMLNLRSFGTSKW